MARQQKFSQREMLFGKLIQQRMRTEAEFVNTDS